MAWQNIFKDCYTGTDFENRVAEFLKALSFEVRIDVSFKTDPGSMEGFTIRDGAESDTQRDSRHHRHQHHYGLAQSAQGLCST